MNNDTVVIQYETSTFGQWRSVELCSMNKKICYINRLSFVTCPPQNPMGLAET